MRHFANILGILSLGLLPAVEAKAEASYEFSYSGRIVDAATGRPVEGPISMSFTFYHQASGGSPVLTVSEGLEMVPLEQGVFQITLTLSASDYHRVFSGVEQPVFVSVTDITHSPELPYARQQVSMVPYAAKVPIDGVTIRYNDQGQLYAPPQTIVTGVNPGDIIRLDDSARLPSVDGSQLNNVSASKVGDKTAEAVAASTLTVERATSSPTPNTIVFRDGLGGFEAGRVQIASLALISGQYTLSLIAPPGMERDVSYMMPGAPIAGQFLTTNESGQLAWTRPDGFAAATVPASGIQGLTAGSIPFAAAQGAGLAEDPSNLSWNPIHQRLGVGTNDPQATVDVRGNVVVSGGITAPTASANQIRLQGTTPNGPGYLGLKAPEDFPASLTWTLPTTDGVPGQIMSTNGQGDLQWIYLPQAPVTSVANKIGNVLLDTNDVEEAGNLYFTQPRVRQSLNAMPPLAYNEGTGVFSMGQASSVSSGFVTSTDWLRFNSKQDALGFTPVNIAGDTMSGTLNMGGLNTVTNLSPPIAPTDATTKVYVDAGLATKVNTSALGDLAYKSTVTSGDITNETIMDADISPDAAIIDTKLAQIVTPGKVSGAAITFGTITGSSAINTTGNITTSGAITGATSIQSSGPISTTSGVSAASVEVSGGITSVLGLNTVGTISASGGITTSSLTTSGPLNATAGLNVTGNTSTTGDLSVQGALTTGAQITSGGNMVIRGATSSTNDLRFNSQDNNNYVGFKAPNTLSSDTIWTLPSGEGSAGQVLSTNGLGSLRWINQPHIPVTTVAGRTGDITLTTADVGENPSRPYFSVERARSSIKAASPLIYDSTSGEMSIQVARQDQNGYLSASDWITFNGKQNNLGYVPLNAAGGTMTGNLNMGGTNRITNLARPVDPTDAATRAYVTESFDSKVNVSDAKALAYKNFVAADDIYAGSISNVHVAAGAAIADTKLATISTPGKVSGNAITSGTISQNASINTGGSIASSNFIGLASNTQTFTTSQLRFYDLNNRYVGFRAPSNLPVAPPLIWTLPAGDGSDGQVLKTDGSGTLSWVNQTLAPVTSVNTKVGAVTLTTADISEGGTNFYFDEGRARRAIIGSLPIMYNNSDGTISIGKASSVSNGYLAYNDWVAFSSKQDALGYTPVRKNGGDTMAGDLSFAEAYRVTNLPDPVGILDATNKRYVDGQVATRAPLSMLRSLATKDQVGTGDIQPFAIDNSHISPFAAISDGKLATITTPGKVSGNAITTGTIRDDTSIDIKGTITTTADTTLKADATGPQPVLRFVDRNGNVVGFRAPSDLSAASKIYTLPARDGDGGMFLSTNGSGQLSWVAERPQAVISVANKTGAVQLDTTDVDEGQRPYFSDIRARRALSRAAPLTYDTDNGVFGISQASAGSDGYLSSSDWTTFNNKMNQLPYVPLSVSGDNMAGNLNMKGQYKIVELVDPTGEQDAATKSYVDDVVSPKADKTEVKAIGRIDIVKSEHIDDGTIIDSDIAIGAGISDRKLADITSSGKVLGNAIVSGTIGGTTSLVTSGTVSAKANIIVNADQDNESKLLFSYTNGSNVTNSVGFKAPAGLATSTTYTLPLMPGAIGTFLSLDTFNNELAWTMPPAAPVSTVAGRTGAISLTTADVGEDASRRYFYEDRVRSALSFTAPLTYNTTTGTFGIQQADGSQNGYLSSEHWATFNGKQDKLTITPLDAAGTVSMTANLNLGLQKIINLANPVDGQDAVNLHTLNAGLALKPDSANLRALASKTTVATADIDDGAITNAKIVDNAGIPDSKLATISTGGRVVGNAIVTGTIGGTTSLVTSGTVSAKTNIIVNADQDNESKLLFSYTNGSNVTNSVGFKAPAGLATSTTYTLPLMPGAIGTFLSLNSFNNELAWTMPAAAPVSTVAGRTGAISLTTADVGEDASRRYFYEDRVRSALSFTAPLTYNTTTGTFGIQQANGSQNGYLSSEHWATFNGKQDKLTITPLDAAGTVSMTANLNLGLQKIINLANPVDGQDAVNLQTLNAGLALKPDSANLRALASKTTVATADIDDGAITNAKIVDNAGIPDSKLATISTGGRVVGNAIVTGTIGGTTSLVTSGTVSAKTNIIVNADQDNESKLLFSYTNGSNVTNSVGFKAPAGLATSTTYTLPLMPGAIGTFLSLNSFNNELAWTMPAAAPVSTVAGRTGAISLTTADVGEDASRRYFYEDRVRSALSFTGPLTYNTTTGTFGIQQADGSQNGYLSSEHWATFNGKQDKLTITPLDAAGTVSMTANLNLGLQKIINLANPVDGQDAVNLQTLNAGLALKPDSANLRALASKTTVATADIDDGAITNAKIVDNAGIPDSKLATISTGGRVVGNAIVTGTIGGTTSLVTSGTVSAKTNIIVNADQDNESKLLFSYTNGSNVTNSVGFKAPAGLATSTTYTLPLMPGAIGTFLSLNSFNNELAWTMPAAAPVSTVAGRTGAISLTTADVGEDASRRYFYEDRVRSALSFTGPLTYNTTTGTFGIQQADGSQNGYLSSEHWATFNGKQDKLTITPLDAAGTVSMTANLNLGLQKIINLANPVDGQDAVNLQTLNAGLALKPDSANLRALASKTTVATADIDDGAITNAKIVDNAGIPDSKLATISTGGRVVGNAIVTGTIGGTTSLVTSGTVSAKTNIIVNADQDNESKLLFSYTNGSNVTNSVGFKAPAGLATSTTYTLPLMPGAIGTFLSLNSFNNELAWTMPAAAPVSTVAGRTGAISLTTADVGEDASRRYFYEDRVRSALSFTAPLTYNTTTGTFGIQQANGSQNGYLSSEHWATFNGKQDKLTITPLDAAGTVSMTANLNLGLQKIINLANPVDGQDAVNLQTLNAGLALKPDSANLRALASKTTVATADIDDGAITNAKIVDNAGIPDSKLATISSGGKVSGNAITTGTIGGTTNFDSSGFVRTTGNLTLQNTGVSQALLQFNNSVSGQTIGFKAPSDLSTSTTYTLPLTAGTTGTLLSLASGTQLEWISPPVAPVSTVAGRTGAISLTTADVGEDASRRYFYEDRVRSALSFTAPLTYHTTTGTFGIQQANGSQNGYLSSEHWATFNGKQDKLTITPLDAAGTVSMTANLNLGLQKIINLANPVDGQDAVNLQTLNAGLALKPDSANLRALASKTTVATADIDDGAITNAKIVDNAGIPDSKLATISSSGKVSGNAITTGTIGGTTNFDSSGFVRTTGNLTLQNTGVSQALLQFNNSVSGQTIGFKAPSDLSTSTTYTLPLTAGTTGTLLSLASGTQLEWISPPVAPVSTVAGRTGAISLTTADVGEDASRRYFYEDRVRSALSFTAPLTYNTTTGTFGIQQANGSQNGYLSSEHWATFNGKQDKLTITPLDAAGTVSMTANLNLGLQKIINLANPVDGQDAVNLQTLNAGLALKPDSANLRALASKTTVATADIDDGAITNAKIVDNAGIPDSKLATISSSGKVSGNAITTGTIGGTTNFDSSGFVRTTGNLTLQNTGVSQALLQFNNSVSGQTIGFKAPSDLSTSTTYTLPLTAGTTGTLLSLASGTQLEWISPPVAPVSTVAGRTGAISLTTADVGEDASRRYFYEDRVRSALSFTAPLTYNTTTGTFGIQQANGSQNGYLSSEHWATFNGKQDKLTITPLDAAGTVSMTANLNLGLQKIINLANPVDGQDAVNLQTLNAGLALKPDSANLRALASKTTVATADIDDGAITNAKIVDNAGIPDSKLATISTGGKVSGNAITTGTIGGTTNFDSSGFVRTTGNLTLQNTGVSQALLQFNNSVSGQTIGFKAPSDLSTSTTYTLPLTAGTTGTLLSLGIGTQLEWISPPVAPVSTVAGRTGAISLTTADVGEDASRRYFYEDRVRSALSFTAPLTYNTTTGTFGIQQANGSQNGYLSSEHWATFNGKQDKLTITPLDAAGTVSMTANLNLGLQKIINLANPVDGQDAVNLQTLNAGLALKPDSANLRALASKTTVATADIDDGAITNAKIVDNAGIPDSKLATISTGGKVSGNAITTGTIGGTTNFDSSGFVRTTGNLTLQNTGVSQALLQFNNSVSGQTIGFKAPSNLSTSTTYTLPLTAGTTGTLLSLGSGTQLEWISPPTAPVSTVAGRTGAITLTTADVGENASRRYFYEDRVRSALLANSPLTYDPNSGTFGIQQATNLQPGYLSSADWVEFNSKEPALGFIPLATDGSNSMTQNLNMNTKQINKLADPTVFDDAANKKYVDDQVDTRIAKGSLGALSTLSSVTSSFITNGTIKNEDIEDNAGIPDSKLATITTVGKVSGAAISSGTIGGTTAINISGAISTSSPITVRSGSQLRLNDSGNSNYVSFQAPTTLTNTIVYTLPPNPGTSGQFLTTNGSGGDLSWTYAPSAPVLTVAGKTGNVSLTTQNVTESASGLYFEPERVWRSLSANPPLSFATATGFMSISAAGQLSDGYLTKEDWDRFDKKEPALGGPALLKDRNQTMNGQLSMNGNRITSLGAPSDNLDAATKLYVDDGLSTKFNDDDAGDLARKDTISLSSDIDALVIDNVHIKNTTITDAKLLTISTAGKVSGNAINSGTITGATTGIDIGGAIATTSEMVLKGNGTTTAPLKLNNPANSRHVGFRAPTNVVSDQIYTLPGAIGSNGAFLSTDSSGNLSWRLQDADKVTSVNGGIGDVTLRTSEITENGPTNLYFSTARAQAAITVSSPLQYVGGTISLPVATDSASGYLSSTDWDTFNKKQDELVNVDPLDRFGRNGMGAHLNLGSYRITSLGSPSTGTDAANRDYVDGQIGLMVAKTDLVGTIAYKSTILGSDIFDGTITNADISNSAAIADSKLATITSVGKVSGNAISSGTIRNVAINTTGQIASSGNFVLQGSGGSSTRLIFNDGANSAFTVAIQAPNTLTQSAVYTWPSTPGTTGTFLTTNNSGELSWSTTPPGAVTSVAGLTGAVSLTTANVPETASRQYFETARARAAISVDPASPLSYVGGVISLQVANSGQNGYLSSADWTIFNNKQAALNFTPIDPAIGGAMSGTLTFNGVATITGLPDPVPVSSRSQAATKGYVDDLIDTRAVKASLKALASKDLISDSADIAPGTILNSDLNGGITDDKLATISTGGKVGGNAISGGTLTTTAIDTNGQIATSSRIVLKGASELRLADSTSNQWVGFKAPSSLSTSVTWTMPPADGSAGAFLRTNGFGVLSWTTPDAAPVSSVNSLTGAISLTSSQIPEGSRLYYTDVRARAALSADNNTPLSYDTSTGQITIVSATSTRNGYLTSEDWVTFNNKSDLAYVPVKRDGGDTLGGDLSMAGNYSITNLRAPTSNGDAATKLYVDDGLTALQTSIYTSLSPIATTGTITTQEIVNGTITDDDISASTSIADTKLAMITSAGKVSGNAITAGTITTTAINTNGQIATTGGMVLNPLAGAATSLLFKAGSGINQVGFKAPASLSSSVTWTLPVTDGSATNYLTTNGSGTLSWAALPSVIVSSVNSRTGAISLTTDEIPETATNLYFSQARARAALSRDASTPLAYNSSTGEISIVAASATQNGYLTSAHWATFNSKQDDLGFDPVDSANGVMTGTLNMSNQKITNLADNPSAGQDAVNKNYVDAGLSTKANTSSLRALATLDKVSGTEINNASITNDHVAAGAGITDNKLATITTAGRVSGNAITSGTIGGSTVLSTTGTINSRDITIAGAATPSAVSGKLVLNDSTNTRSISIAPPATLSVNTVYTLPATAGSANQILATDGSGNLSWVSQTSGVVTSVGGLTGAVSLTTNLVGENASFLYYTTARARGALSVTPISSALTYNSSTGVLNLPEASASSSGYLSAADWALFNGKASPLAYTPLSTAGGTITTGNLTMDGGTIIGLPAQVFGVTPSTHAASIAYVDDRIATRAASSSLGALASKNTIDSSALIVDGIITNADLSNSANIEDSKLLPITSAGKVSGNAVSGGTIAGSTEINLSGTIKGSGHFEVRPNGVNATELRFFNNTGAQYVGFKANDSTAAPRIWTLPSADGSSGQVLQTNGSGLLSWVANTQGSVTRVDVGTGLTGGPITSTGTIALADIVPAVAGPYTRANITVDAKGRVIAASNMNPINLTTEVTGILPIANGGTNSNSITNNRLMWAVGGQIVSADELENGEIFVGSAGSTPVATTLTSGNSIVVSNGAGAITLDTVQDIRTTASPTFAGLTVSNAAAASTIRAQNTMVVGTDVTGTNAADSAVLRGPDATGIANLRGGNLTLIAGNGTSGGSGDILLQTAPSGSSSASVPTPVTRVLVDQSGNVAIGTTTATAKLDVAGDIKVGPSSAPCDGSAAAQGIIRFDAPYIKYCSGSTWITIEPGEPSGTIKAFARADLVPSGWVVADGSALPVAGNASLSSVFGTTYGGNGSTTFNLPNLGKLHASYRYYRIRLKSGTTSAGNVTVSDIAFRAWGEAGYTYPVSDNISLSDASANAACNESHLTDGQCNTTCSTTASTFSTSSPYSENVAPQYIEVDFAGPIALAGYRISACAAGISKPDLMELEGSHDKANWVAIPSSIYNQNGIDYTSKVVEGDSFNSFGVYAIKK